MERRETSVMFALKELRAIEDERVRGEQILRGQEEARVSAEARKEAERARRLRDAEAGAEAARASEERLRHELAAAAVERAGLRRRLEARPGDGSGFGSGSDSGNGSGLHAAANKKATLEPVPQLRPRRSAAMFLLWSGSLVMAVTFGWFVAARTAAPPLNARGMDHASPPLPPLPPPVVAPRIAVATPALAPPRVQPPAALPPPVVNVGEKTRARDSSGSRSRSADHGSNSAAAATTTADHLNGCENDPDPLCGLDKALIGESKPVRRNK